MYALAIWIRVRHVSSDHPYEDWRPEGAVMMLEPFERIQHREFPPINFLLKLEWKRWGNRPASDLNFYSAEVMDVDDRDNILYSQQYLVSK